MGEEGKVELRTVEHSIPIDILNDLLTRFLIFVPESAKQNLIRICFQIELAHWFYLDFYVCNDNRLKSCSIYEFAAHVFQHIPFLKGESHKMNEILNEWKEYKQSVPTYGAIIFSENMSHVLLVQSYWAKSSWGFPKGKLNLEEDPAHCAVREVLEETGFDISKRLDPQNYLESTINDQLCRLYIIRDVPLSTKFCPKTRCEIKCCSWFAVADLPNNKKDSTPKSKMGVSANSFFMVLPFVKRLKQICNTSSSNYSNNNTVTSNNNNINANGASNNNGKRHRHKSSSFSEGEISSFKQRHKVIQKGTESENNLKNIKKFHRPEKKYHHSKRRLFVDDDPKKLVPLTKCDQQAQQFCAPSWLNFKFDKIAIMECMP